MERTLNLEEKSKPYRMPVQLPREVHAALIEAADAHGYIVTRLASKLILDGLDRLPSKQSAQSA